MYLSMIIGRVCMKKLLISLFMLVPLFTGCANVDTMLTINDNKSASIVTSLTYQGDLSSKADVVALKINELYQSFLDPSYKVDKAYGARLSTITATKSVGDLAKSDIDLSSLGFVSNLPNKRFVDVKKTFLLSSFNIDCSFDATKHEKLFKSTAVKPLQKSTVNPEYFHKYADKKDITAGDFKEEFVDNMDEDTKLSIFEFLNEVDKPVKNTSKSEFTNSFSIQVPSIASYNNADSINGNVYTWNIKKGEKINIKLQYVQYSGFAIAFIILLGILLLVVLANKILKHDSQKRIDNISNIV